MSQFEFSEMRNEAFSAERTRSEAPYTCPGCGGRAFPRSGVFQRRTPHWAHFAGEGKDCPLEKNINLNPETVRAIIFRGNQEGSEHHRIRLLLEEIAKLDPDTEVGSVTTNSYIKFSDSEFGRYPDIFLIHSGRKIALEVQLATISLYDIAARREFYRNNGCELLWITANFDPNLFIKTSIWDMAANQEGRLLSIDSDIIESMQREKCLIFRIFDYDKNSRNWNSKTSKLCNASFTKLTTDDELKWASDFCDNWIMHYSIINIFDSNYLVSDIIERSEIGAKYNKDKYSELDLSKIVNCLITIKAKRIIGSKEVNIKSFLNNIFQRAILRSCSGLFYAAIKHYWPELFEDDNLRAWLKKICRQQEKLKRDSWLGQLRKTLFPDWNLTNDER